MTQETETRSEQRQGAGPSLCRDCLSWFDHPPDQCPHCAAPRMIGHLELAELAIAHIDCDAFYAAIEKRDDPTLKDKPVIVGHPGGRGVVATEPRRIRFSCDHERAKTETRNQPVS
jgi:hypothetical protein